MYQERAWKGVGMAPKANRRDLAEASTISRGAILDAQYMHPLIATLLVPGPNSNVGWGPAPPRQCQAILRHQHSVPRIPTQF